MDPAEFVRELFDNIDREVQAGVNEAQHWIESQVHGAAVQLLNSVLPPIVHTNIAAVKVTESAAVVTASAAVGLTLKTADLGNAVLAGAVADTVKRGIGEVASQSDYAKGVNSIAW